jgi:hypothetical protein
MAKGPLGLNTRLLLPPHRSSAQHARTRRCPTWKCSETKTHGRELVCTLAGRARGPALASSAARGWRFMNDSLRSGGETRRGKGGDDSLQTPTSPPAKMQTPSAFPESGKRDASEGRRCHPIWGRDGKKKKKKKNCSDFATAPPRDSLPTLGAVPNRAYKERKIFKVPSTQKFGLCGAE